MKRKKIEIKVTLIKCLQDKITVTFCNYCKNSKILKKKKICDYYSKLGNWHKKTKVACCLCEFLWVLKGRLLYLMWLRAVLYYVWNGEHIHVYIYVYNSTFNMTFTFMVTRSILVSMAKFDSCYNYSLSRYKHSGNFIDIWKAISSKNSITVLAF